MSTCQSCGGIIGRDCWNPQECAEITAQIYHESAPSLWAPSREDVARVVLQQQYGQSIASSMERRGAVGWLGALEAADVILALPRAETAVGSASLTERS